MHCTFNFYLYPKTNKELFLLTHKTIDLKTILLGHRPSALNLDIRCLPNNACKFISSLYPSLSVSLFTPLSRVSPVQPMKIQETTTLDMSSASHLNQ